MKTREDRTVRLVNKQGDLPTADSVPEVWAS